MRIVEASNVVDVLAEVELLEGIRWYRQSMDPHNTEISSEDLLLFASNSAMSELTNTEKT